MKTILKSIEWVHIPQYSSYNHNYYINIRTGQIMLGVSDDDKETNYNYTTYENMINKKGYVGEQIGFANNFCQFDIPSEYARFEREAEEWEFEFDSERC